MKRVCVYCASSAKVRSIFFDATERLANYLVENDIEVVFGGGAVGLMGKLADTVVVKSGKITGIMPHFMREVEWAHQGVTDFQFTDTMHERKQQFLENIDGLITLPGGSGTFEELFEAITLKRLGLFTKPIVILNTDHFYDPLQALLEKTIDENFMSPKHREMWTFVEEPEDVIPALKNATTWHEDAIQFATLR